MCRSLSIKIASCHNCHNGLCFLSANQLTLTSTQVKGISSCSPFNSLLCITVVIVPSFNLNLIFSLQFFFRTFEYTTMHRDYFPTCAMKRRFIYFLSKNPGFMYFLLLNLGISQEIPLVSANLG